MKCIYPSHSIVSVSQARKRDIFKELREGIGRKGGNSDLRQVTFEFERPSAQYTLQEVLLDHRKAAFLYEFVETQEKETTTSSLSSQEWIKGTEESLQLWLDLYEFTEHLKRYPQAKNESERVKEWFSLRERVLSLSPEEIGGNSSIEEVLSVLSSKLEESIMGDFRSSVWWARMVAHLNYSPPFFAIPYCMFLYDKVLRDVFMVHLLSIGHQFWLNAWVMVEELVRPILRRLLTDEISQEGGEEVEEEGFDKLATSEGLIAVVQSLWDYFLAPDSPCELSGLANSCPAVSLLRNVSIDHYTVIGYETKEVACPATELWNMIGEICCTAQSYINCHLVQSDWATFKLGPLYEMMCCTLLVELRKLGLGKECKPGSTLTSHTFDDVWPSVDHDRLVQNLIRTCQLAEDVSTHRLPVSAIPSISAPPKFSHISSSQARFNGPHAPCNSVSNKLALTPLIDGQPSFTTNVDWIIKFESNVLHDGTGGILRTHCIPVSDVAVSLHARQVNIPENLEPFLYPDLPGQGGHHGYTIIGAEKEQSPPLELFSFVAPPHSATGASFLGICLLVHKPTYFSTCSADANLPLTASNSDRERSTDKEERNVVGSRQSNCNTSTLSGADSLPHSTNLHTEDKCNDESNCDSKLLLHSKEQRTPAYFPCGICTLIECGSFGKQEDAQHRLYQTASLRQGFFSYFQEFKESILREDAIHQPSIMKPTSSDCSVLHHHWSDMNSVSLREEVLPFLKKKEYEISPSSAHNFIPIIRAMSPRHVCTIVTALLSEQKVILVSKSKAYLPIACDALLGLLYPLSWKHVYLPLVPNRMVSTLPQCPVPFFIGILANHLECDESSVNIPDDVIVLNLVTGRISGSFTATSSIKQHQLPYELDDIHEDLIKLLLPEMKDFYCLMESCNKPEKLQQELHSADDNDEKLERSIRLLFCNAISKLLAGVSECCVAIETGDLELTRFFDESAFARAKQLQSYKDVYNTNGLIQLFCRSQMLSVHLCSI